MQKNANSKVALTSLILIFIPFPLPSSTKTSTMNSMCTEK